MKCFDCCSAGELLKVPNQIQRFEYGPEGQSVTLEVMVTVWKCFDCGALITDGDAEVIRDQAVSDYKAGKLEPVDSSGARFLRSVAKPDKEEIDSLIAFMGGLDSDL